MCWGMGHALAPGQMHALCDQFDIPAMEDEELLRIRMNDGAAFVPCENVGDDDFATLLEGNVPFIGQDEEGYDDGHGDSLGGDVSGNEKSFTTGKVKDIHPVKDARKGAGQRPGSMPGNVLASEQSYECLGIPISEASNVPSYDNILACCPQNVKGGEWGSELDQVGEAWPYVDNVSHEANALKEMSYGQTGAKQTRRRKTPEERAAYEEQVKKRRRESAQRSRNRKNAYMKNLECENYALRAEVGRLQRALAVALGGGGQK